MLNCRMHSVSKVVSDSLQLCCHSLSHATHTAPRPEPIQLLVYIRFHFGPISLDLWVPAPASEPHRCLLCALCCDVWHGGVEEPLTILLPMPQVLLLVGRLVTTRAGLSRRCQFDRDHRDRNHRPSCVELFQCTDAWLANGSAAISPRIRHFITPCASVEPLHHALRALAVRATAETS